jgi:hypothetical protein
VEAASIAVAASWRSCGSRFPDADGERLARQARAFGRKDVREVLIEIERRGGFRSGTVFTITLPLAPKQKNSFLCPA